MKNFFYFLFIFLVLLVLACFSQKPENKEIRFVYDAVNKAKAANKLVIIEFRAPECEPCNRLRHDIFENEKNKGFLDKNFFLVKVSPADSIYSSLWKYFNLEYQNSVIFLDDNGNEIDRSVRYDGDSVVYSGFLKDVSEGKNLYSVVFSTYKKDTSSAYNNYLLAKKLMYRYRINDAIDKFNKVLLYDPDNRLGYNPECKLKIAECELILTGYQ